MESNSKTPSFISSYQLKYHYPKVY